MRARLLAATVLILLAAGIMSAEEATPAWRDGSGAFRAGLAPLSACSSPDGTSFYTLDRKFLRRWSSTSGKCLRCVPAGDVTGGLAVSHDGSLLALPSSSGVRLISSSDLADSDLIRMADDNPTAVCFGPTGLLCGTVLGALKEYRFAAKDWRVLLPGGELTVISIEADTAGSVALLFNRAIYAKRARKQLGWFKAFGHEKVIGCHLVNSVAGPFVAYVSRDGLSYFDLDTGEARGRVECPEIVLDSAAFGSVVVLSCSDGSLRIFDYSAELAAEKRIAIGTPLARIFPAGDERIAGITLGGDICVFSKSGECVASPEGRVGPVLCISSGVFEDGKAWFAVGRSTGTSFFDLPVDGQPGLISICDKPQMVIRDSGKGRALCSSPLGNPSEVDVRTGKIAREVRLDEPSPCIDAVRSGDAAIFLRPDGTVIRWPDSSTPDDQPEQRVLPSEYRYFGLSSEGRYAFCYSAAGGIFAVKVSDNAVIPFGPETGGNGVATFTCTAVSGDKAAVARNGSAEIFDIGNPGKPARVFTFRGTATGMALIGDRLALAFDTGIVLVLSEEGDRTIAVDKPVSCLASIRGALAAGFFDSEAFLLEVAK